MKRWKNNFQRKITFSFKRKKYIVLQYCYGIRNRSSKWEKNIDWYICLSVEIYIWVIYISDIYIYQSWQIYLSISWNICLSLISRCFSNVCFQLSKGWRVSLTGPAHSLPHVPKNWQETCIPCGPNVDHNRGSLRVLARCDRVTKLASHQVGCCCLLGKGAGKGREDSVVQAHQHTSKHSVVQAHQNWSPPAAAFAL